jgi:hypothetical protein
MTAVSLKVVIDIVVSAPVFAILTPGSVREV